jgi:hypothetical protein
MKFEYCRSNETKLIAPKRHNGENVTNRSIYSNSDLDLWPFGPKSNPKHLPSISNLYMKFEYRRSNKTKLIARKRHNGEKITNRSIYSNSDLDRWPFEPKSNPKHPPSIRNLYMKFEYRRSNKTKLISRKRHNGENITNRFIYSNSDLDRWPFEPKSNPKHLPSISNLYMIFEYRRSNETKVIVRKRKRYGRTDGQTD